MKTHRNHSRTFVCTLCLAVASVAWLGCDKKDEQQPMAAQQGTPSPAAAPDQPPPPPVPSPQQAAPEAGGAVSDEQLERFAEAFMKVQQLQSKIEKDLSTAQSPDDAKQLQQKASKQAEEIVQEAGLSMNEYTQIAQKLQGDEALRKRLQEKVEDSG